MKNHNSDDNLKFNPESENVSNKLPVYDPAIGNEGGINYRSEEIKSHSFSVRHPYFLAGENIIFEPGGSTPDND